MYLQTPIMHFSQLLALLAAGMATAETDVRATATTTFCLAYETTIVDGTTEFIVTKTFGLGDECVSFSRKRYSVIQFSLSTF
jgi:hypothetical protein